ncbi:hypothetical protein [Bacteroides faecium]|uniref:Uncharacterized protein n=1 Tax=Bacteroides faecium TaxID=2715212 RepID=A0A6H0KHK5_9BACE|nr:hypothetical protein [Bacteroides faecium]QIU92896.1 hypothetical protein BacF7301_01450 [Bacteroides faecium]
MITPQMKDQLLDYIVNNDNIRIPIDCNLMANELNTTSICIEKMINQFARLNLCKINIHYGSTYDITAQTEADDMLFRGGFTFQEDILNSNLDKLAAELKHLSGKTSGETLDSVQKMASIVGSISTALPFINGE